jgi:hypothetical protein
MTKALYLATAAVALMFTANPAAALQPFMFFNAHTNMCLEPQNDSTAPGTPILLEPCTGLGAQQWIYIGAGSAGFLFLNAQTGLCLDARGGATNHTPVQQWPCNGISNEKWQIFVAAKGSPGAPVESRVAGSSSFCLDIPGDQAIVGLAMQIYGCNETGAQLWQLKPATSAYVPNVTNDQNSSTLLAAVNEIAQYGLTSEIKDIPNCFAGHTAIAQLPGPGSYLPAGYSVLLTVYTCAAEE